MSFLEPQTPSIAAVIEDTTPELGGILDVNGYVIRGTLADTDAPGGDLNLQGGGGSSTGALKANQQQDRYTNTNGFGTYSGVATGTAYVVLDLITMSDGTTVEVLEVSSGDIVRFKTITSGGTNITTGVTLTQTSVAPANGQTGFTLTPETKNKQGEVGGDLILTPANNLHPILQRQGNSVQIIGRGNKKDLGKIIVQIKVMIIKGVVLLRIQDLDRKSVV